MPLAGLPEANGGTGLGVSSRVSGAEPSAARSRAPISTDFPFIRGFPVKSQGAKNETMPLVIKRVLPRSIMGDNREGLYAVVSSGLRSVFPRPSSTRGDV